MAQKNKVSSLLEFLHTVASYRFTNSSQEALSLSGILLGKIPPQIGQGSSTNVKPLFHGICRMPKSYACTSFSL
jgi:hypothetical protein